MATIETLLKQGVDKIRRDPWNPHAHIELDRIPAGILGSDGNSMGPWVTLRDISGDPDNPIFEQKMLIIQADPDQDDKWEAWEEVPWPWEKK